MNMLTVHPAFVKGGKASIGFSKWHVGRQYSALTGSVMLPERLLIACYFPAAYLVKLHSTLETIN